MLLLLFAGPVDFCLIVSSFYRTNIVPIHQAVVQLRHVLKKCGCTPLQRQLGEHFNASFVCLRQRLQRSTSTEVADSRPLLSPVPAELERSFPSFLFFYSFIPSECAFADSLSLLKTWHVSGTVPGAPCIALLREHKVSPAQQLFRLGEIVTYALLDVFGSDVRKLTVEVFLHWYCC